jgi:hypothetical protein
MLPLGTMTLNYFASFYYSLDYIYPVSLTVLGPITIKIIADLSPSTFIIIPTDQLMILIQLIS